MITKWLSKLLDPRQAESEEDENRPPLMLTIKWWKFISLGLLAVIIPAFAVMMCYEHVGYQMHLHYQEEIQHERMRAAMLSVRDCPTTDYDMQALIDDYIDEMENLLGELYTPTENPFEFLKEE